MQLITLAIVIYDCNVNNRQTETDERINKLVIYVANVSNF